MTPGANIDQIMAMKRMETFTVQGVAEDVLRADAMAWSGLQSVLDRDPLAAWALKVMQHEYVPASETESGKPAVKFQAEFARKPDESAE